MILDNKGRFSIETVVLVLVVLIAGAAVLFILLNNIAKPAGSQAQQTGSEVADQSGAVAIKVIEIYAENGIGDGSVDYLYFTVKPAPGTVLYPMQTSAIALNIGDGTNRTYSYNQSINCSVDNSSDPTSLLNQTNTHTFGLTYQLSTGGVRPLGSLAQGDLALLCLILPRSISNDELLTLSIIPSGGQIFTTEITTPEVMNTKKVTLFKRA